MSSIDWVIKASKLCNLRCRYCYEWDNLANPGRMSLDLWKSLIRVAYELHAVGTERSAPDNFVTRFIWHGGEPLLLPREYFDAVVEIQRSVFGAQAFEEGLVRNAAQTNLYAPNFALVEHLRDLGFIFGVSHDFVPGVRRTVSGQDTHEQVMRNLQRLDDLGIRTGIIVVLAGHTVAHAEGIYRQARSMKRRIRFLPLADEAGAPDIGQYGCSSLDMVEALTKVFKLWFEDGCPIPIDPLDECLRVVAMKWLGLEAPEYDRDGGLDSVLVVEPDGSIWQICEPSDGCDVLGNVHQQSWSVIRNSAGYRASVDRDRRIQAITCKECPYRGPCDGYPVLSFNQAAANRGECAVFKPLLTNIERELRNMGASPREMGELLNEFTAG